MGAKFKVVPKSSVITKNTNRLMHYLKSKINANIHDEQNINILTKVLLKREVTGVTERRRD